MNDLERALYRDLSKMLVEQRLPNGRPMTDADWWATLNVAETIAQGPQLELHRTSKPARA